MLRFFIRQLGLFVFAAAFIAFIGDGIASIASGMVVVSPFGETWRATHPDSLVALEALLAEQAGAGVRDAVLGFLLPAPTFLVVGTVGFVLMVLGRRRGARRTRAVS